MLAARSVSRLIAAAAAVAIGYITGAAVIFFGLPTSDFFERAFIGARAWTAQRGGASDDSASEPRRLKMGAAVLTTDVPDKTCDAFTLYACTDKDGSGSEAFLIDMRGELVHRWQTPVWQTRLYEPGATDAHDKVHNFKPAFYGLHLHAEGSLLAVSHGAPPVGGCRLAKLDKNSNILWQLEAPIHHDIDVTDDGAIYAIEMEALETMPSGLKHIPAPRRADRLVVFSPDGKPLRPPLSIIEAIRNSPYAMLLTQLGARPVDQRHPAQGDTDAAAFAPLPPGFDLLHTNFVRVLRSELAPRFPAFKAGQVLISMRQLNTIAVLDLDARSVVWAASGPWRAQHDPQFLDNGHLLVFDNRGGPTGSRVLEYDPQTQACPWWFPDVDGPPFYTADRGMAQRLPNGNTLVVDSEGGEVLEVTPNREVVWSYATGRFVTTARRYNADDLRFLGGRHARP